MYYLAQCCLIYSIFFNYETEELVTLKFLLLLNFYIFLNVRLLKEVH